MKCITWSYSSLLGLLVLAVFLYSRPAVGDPAPEESPSEARVDVAKIEAHVVEVTDAMLRDALFELLHNAVKHTPPQKGEGNRDEVMAICRSSQRVFCNFRAYRVTHTDRSVEVTKMVIGTIYDFALSRVSWVTERKVQQDDLAKAHASIKEKHDWIAFSSVAAE